MSTRAWILACLFATPALPCSPASDDLLSAGLIADGERDVPTRVHVAFTPIGVFETVQIDELDVDGATPVATLELNGGVGLEGLVTLEPARRYRLSAESLAAPLVFTTGAGEDTVAPDAPDVELDVIQRGPELRPLFDFCGGGGFDGGSTRIDVLVAGGADVVGVLARDPETGALLQVGRDRVSFVERDAAVEVVDIVAVDRAGNESPPVPVTLDFGGPGGCSQAGLTPSSAALVLALLVLRRRRAMGRQPATPSHM